MSTIDEIIYYCRETHPVGALMVSGEWGSGKTYLIDNVIKEKLASSHVLVRISLFGINSVEELHRTVKKKWVDECVPFFKEWNEETKVLGKTLISLIGKYVPNTKKITDTVLAINPVDFIQIKNRTGIENNEKKVVLVFDDLERTKLNTIEILGCINEYCENSGFSVIVIANEEILLSEKEEKLLDNELSYSEIKEKVVCRTIVYKANYSEIIKSIIESKQNGLDSEYIGFLKNNLEKIVDLFECELDNNFNNNDNKLEGIKKIPKNLRSLKCAFHDFERVFKVLKDENVRKIDITENMISFIAYSLIAKANLVNESEEYGFLFSDNIVKKLYPFINMKALFMAEKNWIIHCVWNEDNLRNEINVKKEYDYKLKKMTEPKEILKVNPILEIDDEILLNGFGLLLNDCYKGLLTFNDYVQFIINSMTMRKYNIPEYESIDWDTVCSGVQISIDNAVANKNYEKDRFHRWIEDKFRNNFDEKELKPYDMIVQFIDEGIIDYEKVKKEYLEIVKKGAFKEFVFSEEKANKSFDRFDKDMAQATLECYIRSPQTERNGFPHYFLGIWGNLENGECFKREETVNGLITFKNLLCDLYVKFDDQKKKIACINLENFINEIKRLIEKYSYHEQSNISND